VIDECQTGDSTPREENVQHLGWIQGVVSRLASNSFLIKGWALTVAAATFGFAVNRTDWRITMLGVLILGGFWYLDSFFLQQERLFRMLFDKVRTDTHSVSRFEMDITPFRRERRGKRASAFFSSTLVNFYGMLVAIGVATIVLAYSFPAPTRP
jgi:hypothetical protein